MKVALLLILFSSLSVIGAPEDPKQTTNFFQDKTKIENPLDLRDPFKSPLPRVDIQKKKDKGYYSLKPNHYTNLPVEEMIQINDIKVIGVVVGKERRAMVVTKDKGPVITLKEGMKIGEDDAELKAILPGGIIIVEKIVNIYGQEEYLETVIPISK